MRLSFSACAAQHLVLAAAVQALVMFVLGRGAFLFSTYPPKQMTPPQGFMEKIFMVVKHVAGREMGEKSWAILCCRKALGSVVIAQAKAKCGHQSKKFRPLGLHAPTGIHET